MIDDKTPSDPAPNKQDAGGIRVELAPGVWVADSLIRVQYSRSGGPGGQNVNKVNTKAQLWVPLDRIVGLSESAMQRLRKLAGNRITSEGELYIIAETERTQERNRQAVMERLMALIAEARIEPRKRKKTKPSRGAKERRLKSKKHRGDVKAMRRGKME